MSSDHSSNQSEDARAPRVRFGRFSLDSQTQTLRRGGEPVEIEPTPWRLLFYLIENRHRAVARREILAHVWPDAVVSDSALFSAVRKLRGVLEDDARSKHWIRTIRGYGYRFVGAVQVANAGHEAPLAGSPDPLRPEAPRATAPGYPREFFVGREALFREISADLDQVGRGHFRSLLLMGEPGIGKTRTAAQIASVARARGMQTLFGRCVEGDAAPAYWPWVRLLRDAPDLEIGDESAAILAAVIPDLREWFSDRAPVPGASSPNPESTRFRLFDCVTRLCLDLARRQPLAIVLDDLHEADLPSLRLLEFLVREVREAQLLLVCTFRDTEIEQDPVRAQLLGAIARAEGVRSHLLAGLTREEVERFLEVLSAGTRPPEFVTTLHARTGGNPLFLTQLIALILMTDDERADGNTALPTGVREVIERHLDALPHAARACSSWRPSWAGASNSPYSRAPQSARTTRCTPLLDL